MKIIPFEEKYRQDFIDFNTDWIVSNFGFLEEHDKETFEKIDEKIKAGAMIFFAVENDIALATCMAVPMEGTTWEICKLGSNKKLPHKGAGSAVFKASMDWALSHGAERLFILSNSKSASGCTCSSGSTGSACRTCGAYCTVNTRCSCSTCRACWTY